MRTRSIDEERWKTFADRFSRSHDGWVASLQIRDGDSTRTEVEERPFRGATVEKRSGHGTMILTFGYEPEEHFAHIIHEPHAVLVSEAEDGSEASLKIDAGDCETCVLLLENPIREEDFYGA